MVVVAAWLVAIVCSLVLLPFAINLVLLLGIAVLRAIIIIGAPLFWLQRFLRHYRDLPIERIWQDSAIWIRSQYPRLSRTH